MCRLSLEELVMQVTHERCLHPLVNTWLGKKSWAVFNAKKARLNKKNE
jgi:hypothetical protein